MLIINCLQVLQDAVLKKQLHHIKGAGNKKIPEIISHNKETEIFVCIFSFKKQSSN